MEGRAVGINIARADRVSTYAIPSDVLTKRIAKMKLEASRRLKNHPEANVEAKSAGARGELQALSHLASFSDLKSAEARYDAQKVQIDVAKADLSAQKAAVEGAEVSLAQAERALAERQFRPPGPAVAMAHRIHWRVSGEHGLQTGLGSRQVA